jgi:hypothetical protein
VAPEFPPPPYTSLTTTDVAGAADAAVSPPATSVASARPQTATPAVALVSPNKTWTRKRSSDDRYVSATMMERENNVENGVRAYFSRTVLPGPDGAVTDSVHRSVRMETQGDRVDTQALENGGSSQRETAGLGEFCQRAGG